MSTLTYAQNPYLRTASGKKFYPLHPDPDQICIEDIASGLSKICRYAGQIPKFYSVAEHSVEVARLLPQSHKLAGLLHDASEAYLVDIPSPLKVSLFDYQEVEDNLNAVIAQKFGVEFDLQVKSMDRAMLHMEFFRFFPNYYEEDIGEYEGLYMHQPKYLGLFPELAEFEFLETFHKITNP